MKIKNFLLILAISLGISTGSSASERDTISYSKLNPSFDALLIVDLWPSCDARVIENNIRAIDRAVSNSLPIILVEMFFPTHTDILNAISHFPSDYPFIKITKMEADAFTDTSLAEELNKFAIKKPLISGAYTDLCIKETIYSGIQQGFEFFCSANLLEGGKPDYVDNLNSKLTIIDF